MRCIDAISKGMDFRIRFILEVGGAGGAVWGMSEVMGLRNSDDPLNNNCWRGIAIGIGAVALIRFAYLNSSRIRGYFEPAKQLTTPLAETNSTEIV